MDNSEPRRYLLAVEAGSYAGGTWPPLQETRTELTKIVGLLTSADFRYQRILEACSREPQRETLLKALALWCRSDQRRHDDHLILYWTGHGAVVDERLYLVLPATQDLIADGLSLDDLISVVLGAGSRTGPTLLLLDMCFAGQGIVDMGARWGAMTRARHADRPAELGVICAAGARGRARQLVFADAFTEAVNATVDPDKRLAPTLSLAEIQRRMTASLEREGQYPFLFGGNTEWKFLRNPHRVPHWPRDADAATESLLARLDGVARGALTATSAGWFFKGRKQVFVDLCRWLQPATPPGLCRITGGVGAGKSAVLARLYTLSIADYRRHVPPEVLAGTELPNPGTIDGMIVLHNKHDNAVFHEIVGKLRLQANTPAELIAELERAHRRPVMVFDGLDEADRPGAILALLETLARSAVKVIVGVRAQCVPSVTQAALTIDLDAAPWRDPGAVADYVSERLRNEDGGDATDTPNRERDIDAIARVIVSRAQGNFLLANLMVTARTILPEPDDAGRHAWFPANVGEAFDLIFGRLHDEKREREARDILLPLAYAEGDGLPAGALWCALASRLSGRDHAVSSLDAVLDKLPWFVQRNQADGRPVYRLFHMALAEHLKAGCEATGVQRQIVAVLQACLASADSQDHMGGADVAYARRHLAAHLRRAGAWKELGQLVLSPEWMATKSGRLPFESAGLAADMDQALQAARDANTHAARNDLALPALAETLWSMVWRSAHVTLLGQTPPAAWPLLIQSGVVTPGRALRLLAGIGDETGLASRLAALAAVVTGPDLDQLLDFAEGITGAPADPAQSPHTNPFRDKPLVLYQTILLAAVQGQDCPRVLQRTLDAATLLQDSQRATLLSAAMPHFDAAQLDAAGHLADAMTPSPLDGSDASARAGHTAECVRRGDLQALARAQALPRDCLDWWFTAARLFELEKVRAQAVLTQSLLTDELVRADTSIDDGYLRLHVLGLLAQALPAVASRDQRAALALFLRRLHSNPRFDFVVRQAAPASQYLPAPHGARLLRWARARLLLARQTDTRHINFNWIHTPPVLASAFAARGDLVSALDMLGYAGAHDFYRPKAYADVAHAYGAGRSDATLVPAEADSLLGQARHADMRTQFLCARAATLSPAQRPDVSVLLATLRLEMGDDLRLARCAVLAARARHTGADGIDELLCQFQSLAPPGWIRQSFAAHCAAGGHVRAALAALATVGTAREDAWAATLSAAVDGCVDPLLLALGADADLTAAMLTYAFTSNVLLDLAAQAPAGRLQILCSMAMGVRYPSLHYYTDDLKCILGVRAFELGEPALARRLLNHQKASLFLLHAARRLRPDARAQFIALIGADCLPPEPREAALFAVVARYLAICEASMTAAAQAIITDQKDANVFLREDSPLLDLFEGAALERLRCFAITTELDTLAGSDAHSFAFSHHFSALLPWMNAEQLDSLVALTRRQRDEHAREEALVQILPHYAQRHGWAAALRLRASVGRHDFRAVSWGAVWAAAPEERQAEIFAILTIEPTLRGGTEADALATLAPHLSDAQLVAAIRWIIVHHRHNDPERLGKLVDAACLLPRMQAMACWDAITSEAARLPCLDAASWLASALPLAERLGGPKALAAIDAMLARAASQWPSSGGHRRPPEGAGTVP